MSLMPTKTNVSNDALESRLTRFKKAVKKGEPSRAACELESPRPPGLAEAALRAHPELLPYFAEWVVDEVDAFDPTDVARAIATMATFHHRGEWFGGWEEAIDTIVAKAYAKAPEVFTGFEPKDEMVRRGLLLVKRRFGHVDPGAVAELRPFIVKSVCRHSFPRRAVGPSGTAPTQIKKSGLPVLAPQFASVFGTEAAFIAALRTEAIASFETMEPKFHLLPLVLAGANDEELRTLLIAGEKSVSTSADVTFGEFAEAVRDSGIPASRFIAITRALMPNANGASLAGWGAILAGGAAEFPPDLDDRLDLWPCIVRVEDADGMAFDDIPLMLRALAPWPVTRLRTILDRSWTRSPDATFFSGSYTTTFAFLGRLDDMDRHLERYWADRAVALAGLQGTPSDRDRIIAIWSSITFAGPAVARALFAHGQSSEDSTAKRLALKALHRHVISEGTLPDGMDAILAFGAADEKTAFIKLVRSLPKARRDALIADVLDGVLAGRAEASLYGGLIALDLDASRLSPLSKKQAATDALMVAIQQLYSYTRNSSPRQAERRAEAASKLESLDAWLPSAIAELGIKPSRRNKEYIAGCFGRERMDHWLAGAGARPKKKKTAEKRNAVIERIARAHVALAKLRGVVSEAPVPLSEDEIRKLEELAGLSIPPLVRAFFTTRFAPAWFDVTLEEQEDDDGEHIQWLANGTDLIQSQTEYQEAKAEYEWDLPPLFRFTSDEDFYACLEDGAVIQICGNEGNIESDLVLGESSFERFLDQYCKRLEASL